METASLKKFAQEARRQLLQQVAARLEHVLRSDSVEIREKAKIVAELKTQIEASSKQAVIDLVAYTWFNRFCALRFMDVNHYTRIGAVSPVEDFTQPEILQEAKQGHIDENLQSFVDKQTIFDLLNGKRPSSDPQQEAYRLLLVGICNSFNEIMPFMFEKIEDFTELLMPLDLLSENSVLHDLREALTPEACQDVEVIGWLYQYYISERKDEVFEALKQNKKIEAQDIPASTQLFTPHWIVRYLVENSLGRLWVLNHPDSQLTAKMEYYIKPEQAETDFLKIDSPEVLKICDPACGSGHMLTYAFDLLFAIYEEEGYPATEISRLILEKNLFGIEIDPRAGALSAFAVFMKARSKERRFFNHGMQPNICVLENVTFTDAELKQYMSAVGHDMFTEPLKETLRQFEQANNFGSLIRPILKDPSYVRGMLEGMNLGGNLFLYGVHERVLNVLKQAEFLAPRYHIVVANPPFMSVKGMSASLKNFLSDNYSVVKSNLFTSFIIRNFELAMPSGYLGFLTPFVWMYLSSHEKLRSFVLSNKTILSLVKPSYTFFFESAIVALVAFTIKNSLINNLAGDYFDLGYLGSADSQPIKFAEAIIDHSSKMRFRVCTDDFKKIPGNPIAYWVSERVRNIFQKGILLEEIAQPRQGLATGDNERFLRYWHEISRNKLGIGIKSKEDAISSRLKWFPYNKGGDFRKWYGNNENIINWEYDGKEIRNFKDSDGNLRSRPQNTEYYFRDSITWSFVSSQNFGARYSDYGAIFDVGGSSVFLNSEDILGLTGYLCSKLSTRFMLILNPTANYQVGNVASLPVIFPKDEKAKKISQEIINFSKQDWNSYENSWGFTNLSLISASYRSLFLSEAYKSLRQFWFNLVQQVRNLEIQNNSIFIETYGLQDELTPEVPLEEISLTCNPYYRYGGKKSEEELEALLLADTMKEFISYAVGCMFGRFSLDKPGLILANQGENINDYLKQIPIPTFMPDEGNVIPILEGEWFNDDICVCFKKFLHVTFGNEHYEENLTFIEESIGRDIRSYFTKEFYKDHVQIYKKRPIYWMFSSPKGSFNALIYMHRYKPDTISILLDSYLREYVKKLTSHKSHLEAISVSVNSSQSQKTKALREITQVNTILAELKEYERDIYELASKQIKIDLDDGVKVNYGKFGSAFAKIPGI